MIPENPWRPGYEEVKMSQSPVVEKEFASYKEMQSEAARLEEQGYMIIQKALRPDKTWKLSAKLAAPPPKPGRHLIAVALVLVCSLPAYAIDDELRGAWPTSTTHITADVEPTLAPDTILPADSTPVAETPKKSWFVRQTEAHPKIWKTVKTIRSVVVFCAPFVDLGVGIGILAAGL